MDATEDLGRAGHADARLRAFAAMVEASEHNLVSARARTELMSRHVPECVAFAARLPAGPARVLDIGSGGGFPGVIVAITRPDLDVELLDATSKKTAFVKEAASSLELDVVVHTGRAEELARREGLEGGFDVVTARAVAPLARLVVLAAPFLRPRGLLYAIKGARWAEEVAAAAPVLRRVGMSVVATPDESTGRGDVSADGAPPDPRVVILARTI